MVDEKWAYMAASTSSYRAYLVWRVGRRSRKWSRILVAVATVRRGVVGLEDFVLVLELGFRILDFTLFIVDLMVSVAALMVEALMVPTTVEAEAVAGVI